MTPNAKNKRYCSTCGGVIDSESKKCFSCGKQYFRFPRRAPLKALLIMLLVVLFCLNVYQFVSYGKLLNEKTTTISDMEQQVKSKDSTIATQKAKIGDLENEVDRLEVAAGYYDDICELMVGGNIGYATSNFRVSDSIVVLRKTDINRKFTLTANWSNGGNVSLSYSSLAAHISFDNNTWSTSTTMTVEPITQGATVVTFSNDVDSSTFKMLIIVT